MPVAASAASAAMAAGDAEMLANPGRTTLEAGLGFLLLAGSPSSSVQVLGASTSASTPVTAKHVCSFCNRSVEHASWIAWLQDEPPGYPWPDITES